MPDSNPTRKTPGPHFLPTARNFRSAGEAIPGSIRWSKTGFNFKRARQWRQFSPGYKPPAEAMRWYEDAQHALAEGAAVRAAGEFRRAISLAPAFSAAHAGLADAMFDLDKASQAREEILRATRISASKSTSSGDQEAYISGIQHMILRECPESISALHQWSSALVETERPYALTTVARVMERCDRADDAASVLSEASVLDPRNAAVLVRRAMLASRKRDYQQAYSWLKEAEAIYEVRGSPEGIARVLQVRGSTEAQQNRLDDADSDLNKAAEKAGAIKDIRRQVSILLEQAVVLRKRGRMDAAKSLSDQATDLAQLNDLEELSIAGLMAGGNILLAQRLLTGAESYFRRALDVAERNHLEEQKAFANLSLASAFLNDAYPVQAGAALANAQSFYLTINHRRNLAYAKMLEGQILMVEARYPEAAQLFAAELASTELSSDAEQILTLKSNLASVKLKMGDFAAASDLYSEVADAHHRSGNLNSEFFSLLNLADAASSLGDPGSSDSYFSSAKAIVLRLGPRPDLDIQASLLRAAVFIRRESGADALKELSVIHHGPLADELQLRAAILRCRALGLTGHADDGSRQCLLAEKEASSRGMYGYQLEASLAEAELLARTGNFQGAARIAMTLSPALEKSGAAEDAWRATAICAATASCSGAGGAEALDMKLSHSISEMRLKWGEPKARSWERRPDISRVLSMVRNERRKTT